MVTNTQDEEDSQDSVNYKAQYRNLKRKLKFLIYVSSLRVSNNKPSLINVMKNISDKHDDIQVYRVLIPLYFKFLNISLTLPLSWHRSGK